LIAEVSCGICLANVFAVSQTMVVAVQSAKSHLPPDYHAELDGQFSPGILNTVVFLVSSVQQVTVFFVNIQGYPFMTGMTENSPLLWSLAGTFILVFMFASESVPQMNRYFQLVAFPDESFRNFILAILVLDLVGSFVFDRLMKFIFAREILLESVKGTTSKDVYVFGRTFLFVGFLMYYFIGNEDAWTEIIAREEAMLHGLNSTSNETSISECLDGVCEAVSKVIANTVPTVVDDEF
jgi:manganese-transporting P-type ATPase